MKITINAIPKGPKWTTDDSLLGQHEPHKHQKDQKDEYLKYLVIKSLTKTFDSYFLSTLKMHFKTFLQNTTSICIIDITPFAHVNYWKYRKSQLSKRLKKSKMNEMFQTEKLPLFCTLSASPLNSKV